MGENLKIFKNKLVLGLSFIIALVLITFSYSKIKEYIVLKDVFVFTKENVVSTWRVKKGDTTHDYDYKLESNDIDFLSDILGSSKLKEADINHSLSNTLGNMTILLDGETREEGGGIAVEFERGITLTPIDKEQVYVFLDINKPRNDGSFNSVGVMQKSYIIHSEELVEFISKNT